jgi:thioester reductase-like protein
VGQALRRIHSQGRSSPPRKASISHEDQSRMPASVFLTGVTGFVGSEVLYELLARTDARVDCLIRARNDGEATDRLRAVVTRMLGDDGWEPVHRRVTAVRGDLLERRLGLAPATIAQLVESTTHIVHGAASVSFGMSLARARAVNVRGTLEMLTLAETCMRAGRLQRFGYVSTAFVSGRYDGVFGEDQLDARQEFRNTYERTKFEAEQTVRWRARDLPVTVVRPSIVVGHSSSGATRGFNVVYWPLRLYADGVFRYAPARPDLPVDLVPVDYVARGTVEAVIGAGQPGATYTLAAGPHATSAHAIAELAAEVFGVTPPLMFSTPLDRLVLPLAVRFAAVGPWSRYARSMRVYLPYFLLGSRFDTRNAEALLRPLGIAAPAIEEFLRPVLEFARDTDFGRDRWAIERREVEVAADRLGGLRPAPHPKRRARAALVGA